MSPTTGVRTERAVRERRESRPRRNAVGKKRGNALFYNVFEGFSVNYQNMQSIRMWAPLDDGTEMNS